MVKSLCYWVDMCKHYTRSTCRSIIPVNKSILLRSIKIKSIWNNLCYWALDSWLIWCLVVFLGSYKHDLWAFLHNFYKGTTPFSNPITRRDTGTSQCMLLVIIETNIIDNWQEHTQTNSSLPPVTENSTREKVFFCYYRVRTGMFSHTCVRTPRRVLIG